MHYDLSYLSKKEQDLFNKKIKENYFSSKKLTVTSYDNARVITSPIEILRGGGGYAIMAFF